MVGRGNSVLTLSAPEDLGDVKLNHRVRLKSHVKKFQIGGSRSWRTISSCFLYISQEELSLFGLFDRNSETLFRGVLVLLKF